MWTQKRTQNVMIFMPLMTLLLENNVIIQVCWGDVEALSRRKPGFKSPWDYQNEIN